jgi:hypothetical protein
MLPNSNVAALNASTTLLSNLPPTPSIGVFPSTVLSVQDHGSSYDHPSGIGSAADAFDPAVFVATVVVPKADGVEGPSGPALVGVEPNADEVLAWVVFPNAEATGADAAAVPDPADMDCPNPNPAAGATAVEIDGPVVSAVVGVEPNTDDG